MIPPAQGTVERELLRVHADFFIQTRLLHGHSAGFNLIGKGSEAPKRCISLMEFKGAREKSTSDAGVLTLRLLVWTGVVWFCVSAACAQAPGLLPVDAFGVRIPRGFRIGVFADNALAGDVHAMAIHPSGSVAVSSPGSIRILRDTDADGVADTGMLFAAIARAGTALCWESNRLYFAGEGWLQVFEDLDWNDVADGPPTRLLSLGSAGNEACGIRKGPDGAIYVLTGNGANFGNVPISGTHMPRGPIEGGTLLRVGAGGRGIESLAHGFHSPGHFDFNSFGDLFTFDRDLPQDFLLPWYLPSRLYHVAEGGHHGWRLPPGNRGWPRPDYYQDTVDILHRPGSGAPGGFAVYRHFQFPARFLNGSFYGEANFGRIWFAAIQPAAASYAVVPEVFLERIPGRAFAPRELAITPNGSLLVAAAGPTNTAAIFRIEFAADRDALDAAANWTLATESTFQAALNAPQPLEAWSRATWVPWAQELGANAFYLGAGNNTLLPPLRVRAIEIITELFGGLPPDLAATCAAANAPAVRSRTAWALSRAPGANASQLLLGLAGDRDPGVRRAALTAIGDLAMRVAPDVQQQAALNNLAHPDERVRMGAARVASGLADAAWVNFWAGITNAEPQARLTATLAYFWRIGQPRQLELPPLNIALGVLAQSRIPDERLQAVRLLIFALGDYDLHNPSREIYTGYEPALSLANEGGLGRRIGAAAGANWPSGNALVDFESARLLAMVSDDAATLPMRVLTQVTDRTTPGYDLHYLIVLSRLGALFPATARNQVAHGLMNIDRKLDAAGLASKSTWTAHLVELTTALVERDVNLADSIIQHPAFPRPAHLPLVTVFGEERRAAAARRFLGSVQGNLRFPWTMELVRLLGALPPQNTFPLFRRQWSNAGLRDELLLQLSRAPEVPDREKFATGLLSPRMDVARASAEALLALPRDETRRTLAPAVALLQRLWREPQERAFREIVLQLISRDAGEDFQVKETGTDPGSLQRAYQPVIDTLRKQFPAVLGRGRTAGT